MEIDFSWPAFFSDSRGNRLQQYAVRRVRNSDHTRLYLCGPDEVATQVGWILQGVGGRAIALAPDQTSEWTHRYHVDGPLPDHVTDALDLLTEVLTLATQPFVDGAIALDFYKDPESDPDPKKWKNTAAGSMVNSAKYYGNDDALDDLIRALSNVLRRHPIYAAADFVVSIPGHDTTRQSFGEQLAKVVAFQVGKPLIAAQAVRQVRPAAKQRELVEGGISLADEFRLSAEVEGRVLVPIDDVLRTGDTLRGVAKAAKSANAAAVLGLVGARTMRSR